MPKTKTCVGCSLEFEPSRPNQKYHSVACKQKAFRLRHVKPLSLARLTASQRRADRRRDFHVQRPQELAGVVLPSGLMHESPNLDGMPPSAYGYARAISEKAVDAPGRVGWYSLASPRDPVFDEAIWRLEDESRREKWQRLWFEAIEDWIWLHELAVGVPHDSTITAYVNWLLRWKYHPELTETEGRLIVQRIPALTAQWLRAEQAKQKEKKNMELATIAAQNEEILARIEQLRQTQTEIMESVLETVGRVRERFPNDAEVSAAVDRFLENSGAARNP